ncbi:hypothetical protein PIB30_092207 [Stylosanthes scabra]|uniref:Uncharacterized protein n=1 Tax=Stylosanthes scabra TaxID=79078 RepID=A0ABU6UTI5_9FABA|nr:hypothetical protein [Stylosanthes scabra]
MASSHTSDSSPHSSCKSYPRMDSSASKEKTSPSDTEQEPLIADEAPVMVASEKTFILRKIDIRVPDPRVESSTIWQTQVFLPFKIDSRIFYFLGPILIPIKANSMMSFPSVPDYLPLVFGKKDVDASYFSRRILRTAPPKESIPVLRSWMQRLAPVYGEQWKTLGLTQALQLACEDLSYIAPMVSECLYF